MSMMRARVQGHRWVDHPAAAAMKARVPGQWVDRPAAVVMEAREQGRCWIDHPAVAVMEARVQALHDDPFVVYPYRLTSTSPFGRIPDSALPGSQVPMDSTLPHFDFSQSSRYLTLKLTPNRQYLAEAERRNNTNSTDHSDSSKLMKPGYAHKTDSFPPHNNSNPGYKPSKGIWSGGSLLPEEVRIDISGEEGNVAKDDEVLEWFPDEIGAVMPRVDGNAPGPEELESEDDSPDDSDADADFEGLE
ncbi:hypothetical protein ACOMHN_019868 [Nucella lapillus]